METSFPKSEGFDKKYITAKDFQDNEKVLTFRGWEKIANEDLVKDGKTISTWKDRLKYTLRYSYPEWAIDTTTGERMKSRKGEEFKNRNYDPKFPKGYFIKYIFDEGTMDNGSLPLFNAFKDLQPKVGEKVSIIRTGEGKETEWEVARVRRDGLKEIPEEVVFEDEPVGEDTSTPSKRGGAVIANKWHPVGVLNMVKDLLLSDKDALWDFLKTKRYVKTSEIIRWGSNNNSNRADRNARKFAERGLLRRLTDEEVMRHFGVIGEGIYEVKG